MRSRSVAQDYNYWDGNINIIGSSSSSVFNNNAFWGGTSEDHHLSSPKRSIGRLFNFIAGGSCTSIELKTLSRSASGSGCSIYSPSGVHEFTLSHWLPQQIYLTLMDDWVFGFSALSPNLGCLAASTSDPMKFASNNSNAGAQSHVVVCACKNNIHLIFRVSKFCITYLSFKTLMVFFIKDKN